MPHTPAPWTYSGGEVLDAQGNQIAHLNDSWRDPAEDDANGHLMAAAPEMKSALQLVGMSAGWQYMAFETRAIIEAAIAKAEGRS